MTKLKRTVTILLAIFLLLVLTCNFAIANTTASDYLSEYGAALSVREQTGQYYIFYDVTAAKKSDSLGVSKIEIYRSDGVYMTTILGSTSNGLIRENSWSHTGTYTHYGVSGNSYYAVVTIFAERDGGSDSREITTNTIKVP